MMILSSFKGMILETGECERFKICNSAPSHFTMDKVELWLPAKANFPLGEKQTSFTHAFVLVLNKTSPNFFFAGKGNWSKVNESSISGMYAEVIKTFISHPPEIINIPLLSS